MADVVTIRTSKGVPFTVARSHAERFQKFLDDPEWGDYSFDASQSGGYNPRNIAGTNKPSQHAFGNAIDLNWTRNARGTAGDIDPALARRLAQRHGLTWGGDWKNPDPMHFEVAHAATSSPEQRTPMATYTPQSGMAPFQGDTPEQVEFYRRRANDLLRQGSDTSAVGHWTQALARGVQGAVGGLNQGWARTGELQGKQSLANVLAGAGSAQEKTSALLSNPWGADLGAKLAVGSLQGELEAQSPMGKLNLEMAQLKRDAAKRDLETPKVDFTVIPEGGVGVFRDRTGKEVGRIQGNPKEKEDALTKKLANEQAEIAVKYIQSGDAALDMMGAVNELKAIGKDKDLEGAIGQWMGNPLYQGTVGRVPLAPGNPELNAKINRLQQALSLGGTQAFLKGLGSASDAEGRRVEEAVSNLSKSRNRAEYENNLRIIETGLQRQIARSNAARQRFPQLDVAGYGRSPPPTSQQPAGAQPGAPDTIRAPKAGKRDFNALPRNDQRTALMRLAKDASPETLANFEEEFGSAALEKALGAVEKLRKGTAF